LMVKRFLGQKIFDLPNKFDGPTSILIENKNIWIIGAYFLVKKITYFTYLKVDCFLVGRDN